MKFFQSKRPHEYFLDVIVIIIGILISLYFSNMSTRRENKNEEKRILENLKNNLAADTVRINEALDYFKGGVYTTTQVLKRDFIFLDNADSLSVYFGNMVVYVTMPLQRITFIEISQNGGAAFITNKSLLDSINLHYTQYYTFVEEYYEIDKHHILERMVPFMEDNFDLYGSRELYDPAKKEYLKTFFSRTDFRNYLTTNLIFKSNTMTLHNLYKDHAKMLINAIDEELKKN
ncbi:MAG: hypothetical protein H7Y00_05690 [Fimbriimonadaceae bacterium]|nr:hypothetical protein [Chitinophagales bacterium]